MVAIICNMYYPVVDRHSFLVSERLEFLEDLR